MNTNDYATIAAVLIGHAIILTTCLLTNRALREAAAVNRAANRNDSFLATLRWATDAGSDATNPARVASVRSLLTCLAVAPDLDPTNRAMVRALLNDLTCAPTSSTPPAQSAPLAA